MQMKEFLCNFFFLVILLAWFIISTWNVFMMWRWVFSLPKVLFYKKDLGVGWDSFSVVLYVH